MNKRRTIKKTVIIGCAFVLVGAFVYLHNVDDNSSDPPATFGPQVGELMREQFNLSSYFSNEVEFSDVKEYRNTKTGDKVSFQILKGEQYQGKNPTFSVLVNDNVVGNTGGQGFSTAGFSPDGKFFAFRTRSNMGCAGGCQNHMLNIIDMTNMNVVFTQTPVLDNEEVKSADNRYENTSVYIDSFKWNSDNQIIVTSCAVGLDNGALYRISPIAMWIYNPISGQFKIAD